MIQILCNLSYNLIPKAQNCWSAPSGPFSHIYPVTLMCPILNLCCDFTGHILRFDAQCSEALRSSQYFNGPVIDLKLDAERHVDRSEFPQDNTSVLIYYPAPINLSHAVFNHMADGAKGSTIMPAFRWRACQLFGPVSIRHQQ